MKNTYLFSIISVTVLLMNSAAGQWSFNGTSIFNTNSGNVGIGINTPSYFLHAARNMTEPMITVQNLGGAGGATFNMIDDASGADWKFKATLSGGFKIRDHANELDVIVIEPNSFSNALYIKNSGSIGIGTSTPDNSALVDMTSASKGFLPPRITAEEIPYIQNPANGLQVFNTSDEHLYIYTASNNTWKKVAYLVTGNIIPFSCGSSISINHVAGNIAPVDKTATYITVTNVPGEPSKCWIACNLGSGQQATAKDDATEASAGWYWQFNRQQGYKHDGAIRTPNTAWITNIDENSNWIAVNDPCAIELGNGWRLPTSTEWINVDAAGSWSDWNGPWNSLLKLHAAGNLSFSTATLSYRGSAGDYWSSNQTDNTLGWYLAFHNTYCAVDGNAKAYGFTIRCIRD